MIYENQTRERYILPGWLVSSRPDWQFGHRSMVQCRSGRVSFLNPSNSKPVLTRLPKAFLTPSATSANCTKRASWNDRPFFVQVRPPGESLAETLFIQEPNDFFPGNVNNLWPRDIIIKRERQTFCRLPKTNAVVFTVKTSITPLVRFPKEELRALLPRSGHG